ncbi:TIGR04282 family arsenosugar biosynthesis glycosyltransferase [soil metagenome]
MTKVPQAGYAKTRLTPFLSDDQCAELSKCFLKDTVSKAFQVTPTVLVAYTGEGDEGSILDLLPERTTCIRQSGDSLGERLANAVEFAESNGCSPILVIGTDSPTLPTTILIDSLRHFKDDPSAELVLGGTDDGGYYLIGLKRARDSIFQEITWSTDAVYSETLKQAKRIGISGVIEMPRWYDVDTPDDLRRLYLEVMNDDTAKDVPPKTYRWLLENQSLFVSGSADI